MRIAVLAPIAWRTPPRQYGPWELVASNMTEALVQMGLDITLFATGDSITKAKLSWYADKPYAEDISADTKVNECLHISSLLEKADEFDIIHNHYDFLPLTYSQLINTPMITTIHGFSSPAILPVFKKYNGHTHYVSISDANRDPALDYLATVYNGIDIASFTFGAVPEDYLLFFGRIHPDKGTHKAIELARRCGRKLIIAGLIQDREYFTSIILPQIDHINVVYAGNCDPIQRDKLMSNAFALLHLISFEEPFGLNVVEAMCCGTPVIAFNRGAMPELIENGRTGFLVDTLEEGARAISKLYQIKREACRKRVVTIFSKERMAGEYYRLYQKIIATP